MTTNMPGDRHLISRFCAQLDEACDREVARIANPALIAARALIMLAVAWIAFAEVMVLFFAVMDSMAIIMNARPFTLQDVMVIPVGVLGGAVLLVGFAMTHRIGKRMWRMAIASGEKLRMSEI